MSSAPTTYTPETAFSSFNPSSFPNHGTDTDNEFENIATALGETQDRLAEIQRADGALANGSVGPDQIADSLIAGINTPVSWLTATAYVVLDSVYFVVAGTSGYTKWYKCLVAHTSGVFATDLAAGYWTLILEADAGPTGPAGAGTPGTNTPSTIANSAGVVGTSGAFSREDHTHPYTAPATYVLDDGQTALYAGVFAL